MKDLSLFNLPQLHLDSSGTEGQGAGPRCAVCEQLYRLRETANSALTCCSCISLGYAVAPWCSALLEMLCERCSPRGLPGASPGSIDSPLDALLLRPAFAR